MFKHIVLAIFLLIIVWNSETFAGHGFSDEVYLTRQWRDLETPLSASVNPSFAAYCDWITVSSALSITQLNRFFLTSVQGVIPLTSFAYKSHTVGIGYLGYSAGKFDQTTWDGSRIVKQVGGSEYSEHYGTISWAFRPFRFLATGVNVKLAYQTNFGNPVIDAAFDLGVCYTLNTTNFGKYLLGISLLNPAWISRFTIPVYSPNVGIQCGFEKEIKNIIIDGGIDVDYRSFYGINYSSPRIDIAARLGARFNNAFQLYLQGGKDYGGFSVKIDIDSTVKKLHKSIQSTSAAIQILFTKAQLAPTNTIYLSGKFGKNRSDVSGEANDIYLKAQKKMALEQYWDAYAYFSLLEKAYPKFTKIDEARLRSAMCLEKLYQFDQSIDKFKQTKELCQEYDFQQKRKIMGSAELGLLRITRKFEDSLTVLNQFNLLQTVGNDSLKEHGWYELGQFYIQKKDYYSAIDALKKVNSIHHDYPFAQFSIAICNIISDGAVKDIKRSLNEVIAYDAKTKYQTEVSNKAKYAMGCFYYEEGEYANAQRFLQQIPNTSDIYYDALAVIGWAMFKSQLWEKCRQVSEVMQNSDIPDIQAEGFVLEGYAFLKDTTLQHDMNKRVSYSLQQIEKAEELIPVIKYLFTIDIKKIDQENDSLSKENWSLINSYNKDLENGKERQFIVKRIEDLHDSIVIKQTKMTKNFYLEDISKHYLANQERINGIINDIDYLSAKFKLLHEKEHRFKSGIIPVESLKRDSSSVIPSQLSPAPADSFKEQSIIDRQQDEIKKLKIELEKMRQNTELESNEKSPGE